MSASAHAALGRNSIMNLAGHGLPAIIGLFAIPPLIHGLGTDRFGVLSLVWVIIAYFALFDFGVGRALTRTIADSLGAGRADEIPAQVTAGMMFMLGMGVVAGIAAYFLAPWLVRDALRLPPPLITESIQSFRVLALALPLIVSAPGLHAILVAHGRFDAVNLLRVPVASLGFLLPLAALAVSPSLVLVTIAAAAVHCIGWLLFALLCLRIVPSLRRPRRPSRWHLAELLRFGGWLTVSNVIAPFMLYLDRFLIARLVSPAGVAFYTTPFGIVTQLWLVPRALVETLFPSLSADFAAGGARVRAFYYRGLSYVVAILTPVTALVVIGAEPGLTFWLGAEFAQASYRVAQVLAVGILVNAIGIIATAVIQAAGRPDITARLHIAEAPLYCAYLVWLLTNYGIVGAAVAWLVRVSLSTCALLVLAHRCIAGTTATRLVRRVVEPVTAVPAPMNGVP